MRVTSKRYDKNTFSSWEGYLTWDQPVGVYLNAIGYLGMENRVVLL